MLEFRATHPAVRDCSPENHGKRPYGTRGRCRQLHEIIGLKRHIFQSKNKMSVTVSFGFPNGIDPDFERESGFIEGIRLSTQGPSARQLFSAEDTSKWEEEIGMDAATTSVLKDIVHHANEERGKPIRSDGVITVTPKHITVPSRVPYATFEYDSYKLSLDRTTELSFMDKGAVVVKFRKVTVWEVYFPSSKDTDGFTVDKSICVYIADDI